MGDKTTHQFTAHYSPRDSMARAERMGEERKRVRGSQRSNSPDLLIEDLAEAEVDDVNDRGAGEGGSGGDGDDAEHGEAAVDELSLLGEAGLEGRDEASSRLDRVALLLDQGVLEAKRSEGGKNRHDKNMNVGDQDDGALVGDSLAEAGRGEGTPLVDVQNLVSVRDETVALEVRGHNNEEEAEHGVAAVPSLSVGGNAETAGSELRARDGELRDCLAHRVLGHAQGAQACKPWTCQNIDYLRIGS
jgi:hypothetical protein